MNERGPKIRVACAACDPYFRDPFANCVSLDDSKSIARLTAYALTNFKKRSTASNAMHAPKRKGADAP
jgi:hypothetical protein